MSAAHRLLPALLVAAALTACGGKSEPTAPMKVEDTAFGDLAEAQEKARAVEETTMQHKRDIDRALDDAESGR